MYKLSAISAFKMKMRFAFVLADVLIRAVPGLAVGNSFNRGFRNKLGNYSVNSAFALTVGSDAL